MWVLVDEPVPADADRNWQYVSRRRERRREIEREETMGPRLRMDRLNLCVLIVLPSSGIDTAVYRMLPFTPYAAVYLCIGVVCHSSHHRVGSHCEVRLTRDPHPQRPSPPAGTSTASRGGGTRPSGTTWTYRSTPPTAASSRTSPRRSPGGPLPPSSTVTSARRDPRRADTTSCAAATGTFRGTPARPRRAPSVRRRGAAAREATRRRRTTICRRCPSTLPLWGGSASALRRRCADEEAGGGERFLSLYIGTHR